MRCPDRHAEPRRAGRWIAGGVALALAWPPTARGATPPAAGASDGAAIDRAESAADRAFRAGAWDQAVTLYEAVLGMFRAGDGLQQQRARTVWHLVHAHERQFERDGRIDHLQRARALLTDHAGFLREIAGDDLGVRGECRGEAGEVLEVDAAIARHGECLDRWIEEVEAVRAATAARAARAAQQQRSAAQLREAGRLQISGGAVMAVGGAVGLTLIGVGLGVGRSADKGIARVVAEAGGAGAPACALTEPACMDRYTQLQSLRARGNAGNIAFIAGLVAGPLLLAAGGVLLDQARRRRRDARPLAAAPSLGPGSVGLVIVGRF